MKQKPSGFSSNSNVCFSFHHLPVTSKHGLVFTNNLFTSILELQEHLLFSCYLLKTNNGETTHLTRAKPKIASKIFAEAFKQEQNSSPVGKVDALLNQRYNSSEVFC